MESQSDLINAPNPAALAAGFRFGEKGTHTSRTMKLVAAGERRISVRSGHGVGKSTAAAALMLWFLLTRYPVKIVVTAPTSAQPVTRHALRIEPVIQRPRLDRQTKVHILEPCGLARRVSSEGEDPNLHFTFRQRAFNSSLIA